MTMEHLNHLIESTKGKKINEIKNFYNKTYNARVKYNEEKGLFCPMYDMVKTDFSKIGSLATRGTVFALNEDGVFEGKVACLPFFKFFNYDEKHAYRGTDEDIVMVQMKMDGSLIKVFNHNDEWIVATNGTPVASPEFKELFEKTLGVTTNNFDTVLNKEHTYLFELCTPDNKIVVQYETPQVKLLMVRCKHTFEELMLEESPHFDIVDMLEDFDPSTVGIEGAVIVYSDGNRIKSKTNWYKSLHRSHGKKFNGTHWDSVVRSIHDGYYDDVLVLIPKNHRERAEKYMKNLTEFDAHVESLIKPYKLEKHHDKDELVKDLADGFFERTISNAQLRSAVLNVLFGKYSDVYKDITKSKGKSLRDYIELYNK